MWKVTLGCNVFVLALCWVLCQIAMTPAHNLLVIYSETVAELPVLTDFAIRYKSVSALVPLGWAILTVLLGSRLIPCTGAKRSEWIALHLSCSLLLGLGMLAVFTLAGILPLLKIGASVG